MVTPVRESATRNFENPHNEAHAAMVKAGLTGWNVQKVPMWADMREYPTTPLNGPRAIKDESTFKTAGMIGGQLRLLGTVGDQYQVVQNEEHVEFLNEMIGQAGAQIVGAHQFKGGRLVYVTMKLPDTVLVGGRDPVDMYLNGINSHDGTTHFMVNLSPERAWCANQLPYFRKTSVKFKHSGDVRDKVKQARKALDITFKNVDEFKLWSERLADASMTLTQFESVVDQVFPVPEAPGEPGHSKRTWNNYTKLRDGIDEMWISPANAEIQGTAWGGLQSVIEHLDWVAGSDEGRAERMLTSANLERKSARVYEAFREYALSA